MITETSNANPTNGVDGIAPEDLSVIDFFGTLSELLLNTSFCRGVNHGDNQY